MPNIFQKHTLSIYFLLQGLMHAKNDADNANTGPSEVKTVTESETINADKDVEGVTNDPPMSTANSEDANAGLSRPDNQNSSEVHTSQLTISQSQSVDCTETPTQIWQVPQQLEEEREKVAKKKEAKKRKRSIAKVKKTLTLTSTTDTSTEDDLNIQKTLEDQPEPLDIQPPEYSTPKLSQTRQTKTKRRKISQQNKPIHREDRRKSSRISHKHKTTLKESVSDRDDEVSSNGSDEEFKVDSEDDRGDTTEHDDSDEGAEKKIRSVH